MTLITVTLCFFVACSDPGFVLPGKIEEKDYNGIIPIAIVDEKNYLLKFCDECHIVREIRVFHCTTCNACIMRHGKNKI